MKKYKDKLRGFFGLIVVLLIAYLFTTGKLPSLENSATQFLIGTIFIAAIILRICKDIFFRMGLLKNEIRYTTINDSAHKYSVLAQGVVAVVFSVSCLLWMPEFVELATLGISVGALLIIEGCLFLPNGKIRLKKDKLKLSGISEGIIKDKIQRVEIEESRILLIDSSGVVFKQDMLKLDAVSALAIEQFLRSNIGDKEIINIIGHTESN
jgi:hypothetical protein